MEIQRLELENFHNQQRLVVDFAPGVTNIYGANGAGKTTVLDALNFLLYGKDSKGRSDSSFRPYDAAGELLHDVDTRVKGVFKINGYTYTLEVVLQEQWTKISGSDERRLTGNTTEYFIDGVPKKAKEYAGFVSEFFQEPWFSLTSSPAKFPGLPWREQRQLLIELVGEISVGDVVAANPELQPLEADLTRYSVDDLRKKLDKERKGYAKTAAEIPARIDELTKSLSDIDDAKAARNNAELQVLRAQKPLEALQAQRAEIVNGTRRVVLSREIALLEAQMEAVKSIWREKTAEVRRPFEDTAAAINKDCEAAAAQLRVLRPQLRRVEEQIAEGTAALGDLAETWQRIDAEVFDSTECPCCHRPYSEEMLQPMLEEFNRGKAERLQACDAEGNAIHKNIERYKEEKAELLAQINKLSRYEVEEAPQRRAENSQALAAAVAKVPPVEDFIHPETRQKYWELAESLKLRRRELENADLDIKLQLQNIDSKIADAQRPVETAQNMLLRLKMDDAARERIAALQGEKKNALLRLGDAEQRIHLLNKFVVAKIALLTDNINSMFNNVTFRLFEKNIGNEGIRETCEIMMHGVPYRNLSFAEKHIAGMEIIRTIASAKDLQNPVFIDNRESIVELPPAPGQVINLIVSKEDRALRIEHE